MAKPPKLDLEKTITICEGKKTEIGSNLGLVLEHSFFRELDEDHDGVISVDELEKGLREELKLPVSRTEIQRFFNIIDTDYDGRISEDEFRVFTKSRQRKLKKSSIQWTETTMGSLIQKRLNLPFARWDFKSRADS